MFGRRRTQQDARIAQLEAQVRTQAAETATHLHRLRAQVAGLSNGIPIGVEAILEGRAYTDVAPAQLSESLSAIPNVLILDIRADGPWDQAHIPNAKHVVASQLAARVQEMPDTLRPILVMGADGNDAIPCCKFLAREGYAYIFLAVGGMAQYTGETVASEIPPLDITKVQGTDRALIERVARLIDADVRPGLIRDGGDLELIAIDNGVVTVRMIGACHGCGSQKTTLQHGIKTYLTHTFPEIREITTV